MRRVTMSTSSALVAIWAGKPRSWRIQEQLESNNQANSESNPELHWFCFTLRSDWSAKNRAILYQWNTLVKQIALWQPAFSRLQAVCWCFSFWFLLSTMSYINFFPERPLWLIRFWFYSVLTRPEELSYLSFTAVFPHSLRWHLVGETLNFVILQYIAVSVVITTIQWHARDKTFH